MRLWVRRQRARRDDGEQDDGGGPKAQYQHTRRNADATIKYIL